MFLRAGALSLALLVASRLLGLLRESAQAAAFGATGLADVAVLMLALPDWVAGLIASGALSYVLLPAWARRPDQVAALQRQVARVLLGLGVVLAVSLALGRYFVLDKLAAGLGADLRPAGADAMLFSAVAVPLALLAALWTTRLQHEREFVGMYAANLVVNALLIAALFAAKGQQSLVVLGGGLLLAMGARLVWLQVKLRRASPHPNPPPKGEGEKLGGAMWVWAALAAGLPLALPFGARSLASQGGEGALATFNYAWKLVELPLMLAIQLVATLAFPAIARAVAANETSRAVRSGFALAWTLACAAAAGLLLGAPAVERLLFGWGRMQPEALIQVAQWGRIGAWGLLPQACIAVGVTVLAAQGRMGAVVAAYAAGLAALLASGFSDGGTLMLLMNVILLGVAGVVIARMGAGVWRELPWRTFAVAGVALLVCDGVSRFVWLPNLVAQLVLATFAALAVIGVTAAASPELRAALRR